MLSRLWEVLGAGPALGDGRAYGEALQLNEQWQGRFDQMYDRTLVQTRWLIGAVVSALLAVGRFVK